MVETHSWQHRQGILLDTLRRRLEEAGVRFEQVPRQTLVRKLGQERTSRLAGLAGDLSEPRQEQEACRPRRCVPAPGRREIVGATSASLTSSSRCVPATRS